MKKIFILIIALLAIKAGIYSQCLGYSVTVAQISDGPNPGDAIAQATVVSSNTTYYLRWDGVYINNVNPTISQTLNDGSHFVVLNDTIQNCVDTTYFAVTDTGCPGVLVEIREFNDSCYMNDVTLYVVYGGQSTPALDFQWSTGWTNQYLNSATSGTYTVTATMRNTTCTYTDSYISIDDTCTACSIFSASISKIDSCGLMDVSLNSIIQNGSGNYSFLWNNGSTSDKLQSQTSGVYSLTVNDNTLGCIANATITIVDSIYKCCKANFYNIGDSLFSSSVSLNSSITLYNWKYEDNVNGSGNPNYHSFNVGVPSTVCHFIETAIGCKDTICKTVLTPPPGKNLKVTNYGFPYIISASRKQTNLSYQNLGTTTENAIIEYSYPPGCSFNYSIPPPTSNLGNTLTYNVGSLTPLQNGSIKIYLHIPITFNLGDLKNDTAKILSFNNDIDTSDNCSISTNPVVGSFDPNEKLANPQGEGPNGNIPMNTKEINFLIHFQNEGNWRTYTVRVEDEIDSNFNISTLSLGDVSHPTRMVVIGSKIIWYFDDIELTPKSQNEDSSQGFISYSLKLKNNLPEGSKIKNTAYIYFDSNPAIVTNTTVHTLKVDAVTNGIQSINLGSNQVLIRRNQNDLTLSSEKAIEKIEVFNMNGQKINETNSKSKKVEFEVSSWPSGIYFFNVKIKEEVHQLKIKL